jgi:hypothetical protein
MDLHKYHTNRYISGRRVIIPTKKKTYVILLDPLFLDQQRPDGHPYVLVADEYRWPYCIKHLLLERVVSWIQKTAEKQVPMHKIWLKNLKIKYASTLAEALAN